MIWLLVVGCGAKSALDQPAPDASLAPLDAGIDRAAPSDASRDAAPEASPDAGSNRVCSFFLALPSRERCDLVDGGDLGCPPTLADVRGLCGDPRVFKL